MSLRVDRDPTGGVMLRPAAGCRRTDAMMGIFGAVRGPCDDTSLCQSGSSWLHADGGSGSGSPLPDSAEK